MSDFGSVAERRLASLSGPIAVGRQTAPFAEVPGSYGRATMSSLDRCTIFQMLAAFHRIYDIWRSLVEVISYPDFAFQRPKQLIPSDVKRRGLCIEVLPDDK